MDLTVMYAYSSARKRALLHAITLSSVVAGIVLWALSGRALFSPSWPFQAVGIALCGFGIYLTVRYSLCVYHYEIKDTGNRDADDRPIYRLSVIRQTGRKQTVVAGIDLRDVTGVETLTRKQAKDKGISRPIRCENDPFSPSSVYITVSEDGSTAVVCVEEDSRMYGILSEFVRNNLPSDDGSSGNIL